MQVLTEQTITFYLHIERVLHPAFTAKDYLSKVVGFFHYDFFVPEGALSLTNAQTPIGRGRTGRSAHRE